MKIYLLGAGASAPLGAPIGKDLVWLHNMDNGFASTIMPNGEPDNNEDTNRMTEYRRFLVIAERYYPELSGVVHQWDNRGMSIFCPSQIEKQHSVDDMLSAVYESDDKDAESLIKHLIYQHLSGFTPQVGSNDYTEFILKHLIDNPENTAIITLNFDTFLNTSYGILLETISNIKRIRFNYQIPFDNNYKQTFSGQASEIPLLKLNGSLDWEICKKCGNFVLKDDYPDQFAYRLGKCLKCEGDVEPYIVIPHGDYDERFKFLWENAIRLIRSADELIVIGYSFPQYDNRVRSLFSENLPKYTKITVVDKIEQEKKKQELIHLYKKIFPQNQSISFAFTGFECFLSNKAEFLTKD